MNQKNPNFEPDFGSGASFPTPEAIQRQVDETIPQRCADCPVQCELGKKLAGQLLARHVVTAAAEGLVGQEGEDLLDNILSAGLVGGVAPDGQEGDAEYLKRTIRRKAATDLDGADRVIQDTTDDMKDAATDCKGPLKMRAVSKGGKTYTTTICTSPQCYREGDSIPTHVPAHVTVTSSSKWPR